MLLVEAYVDDAVFLKELNLKKNIASLVYVLLPRMSNINSND